MNTKGAASSISMSLQQKRHGTFRCPSDVTKTEKIEQIHKMLLADWKMKVREMIKVIGISHGLLVLILKVHSLMSKLYA